MQISIATYYVIITSSNLCHSLTLFSRLPSPIPGGRPIVHGGASKSHGNRKSSVLVRQQTAMVAKIHFNLVTAVTQPWTSLVVLFKSHRHSKIYLVLEGDDLLDFIGIFEVCLLSTAVMVILSGVGSWRSTESQLGVIYALRRHCEVVCAPTHEQDRQQQHDSVLASCVPAPSRRFDIGNHWKLKSDWYTTFPARRRQQRQERQLWIIETSLWTFVSYMLSERYRRFPFSKCIKNYMQIGVLGSKSNVKHLSCKKWTLSHLYINIYFRLHYFLP